MRFDGKNSFDYDFTLDSSYLLLSNCDLKVADNLEFIYEINYIRFMNYVNFKLPVSFFQKFSCIKIINMCGKVEDPNLLIKFIKQCVNLSKLSLGLTELAQEFYAQLPSNSSLNKLIIEEAFLNKIELN